MNSHSLGPWVRWRLEFGGTTTRACSQIPVVLPLLSLTILSVLLLVYLRKYGGPEAGTGIWIHGEIIQNSGRNEVLCSGLSGFLGGGESNDDFRFLIVHFLHRC